MPIDVLHEFREVQGELPIGLDRANVIRPQVIVTRVAGVETIPFDKYEGMTRDKIRYIVPSVVFSLLIVDPAWTGAKIAL
jgi:hypothetical protein